MRPQTVTDQKIIDAARDIFINHGTKASVQLIADRVGLSQPAIFKRFGTKKKLIIRALKPQKKPEWFTYIDKGPTEEPIENQLVFLGEEILQFFNLMHPIIKIIQTSGINKEEFLSHKDKPLPIVAKEKVTGWFDRAAKMKLVSTNNADITASIFLGAIELESFLKIFKNNRVSNFNIDSLVETLLKGIGNEK